MELTYSTYEIVCHEKSVTPEQLEEMADTYLDELKIQWGYWGEEL